MEERALQVMEPGGELSLARPADTVFKEAEMVVKPWANKVEALQLYKKIGDSKHLLVEAWQMLGACYRVTARIRETRFVDMGEVQGFEATAEAFHIPTGQVISMADAMCLNDEDKWGPRTKYVYKGDKRVADGYVNTPLQQLRSMAQTRAMSKVLSNLFKWVAVMGKYAGTPAEEMTGDEGGHGPQYTEPQRAGGNRGGQQRQSAGGQQPQQGAPQQQQHSNGGGAIISDAQKKRLWAIAFEHGKKEVVGDIVKGAGIASGRVDELTTDKYEAVIAELQRGDAQ